MAEAPTTPSPPAAAHGASNKKRPLEPGRPEFMAGEAGAYHVLEMPKKLRCGYAAANPRRRRTRSHLLPSNDGGVRSREEKKRALELDDDDEPELVAEEDSGAYNISDMPKKYKCDYMADPDRTSSPFINALDAREAIGLARFFRRMDVSGKYLQELKAVAAARQKSSSSLDG